MNRRVGVLAMLLSLTLPAGVGAQPATQIINVEPPDAQRTKQEFYNLMQRYPPSLRSVLALDPSLLSNAPYLAPYPALAAFLNAHPEIAHNPSFYVGEYSDRRGFQQQDRSTAVEEMWRSIIDGTGVFLGFGMAIGVAVWLVRTTIDYRRWNRLAKVQTDVHTRILDRFTDNAELLAYMQSQPGKRFLESTPIMLDAAPRAVGAPLGRILWSVQAGLVLAAAGTGIQLVSGRFTDDAAHPLQVLGALGIALGVGFVLSALISFMISHKLGLIEPPAKNVRHEPPSGL